MLIRRFTLVEMMVVVAIVAILAAIAIPNVYEWQLKAKQAEVPPNVMGIRDACVAYNASFDAWPNAAIHPLNPSGKTPVAFPGGTSFETVIGWTPDGNVRGSYSMQAYHLAGCNGGAPDLCMGAGSNRPCAGARIDVDGDLTNNCAWIDGEDAPMAWVLPDEY